MGSEMCIRDSCRVKRRAVGCAQAAPRRRPRTATRLPTGGSRARRIASRQWVCAPSRAPRPLAARGSRPPRRRPASAEGRRTSPPRHADAAGRAARRAAAAVACGSLARRSWRRQRRSAGLRTAFVIRSPSSRSSRSSRSSSHRCDTEPRPLRAPRSPPPCAHRRLDPRRASPRARAGLGRRERLCAGAARDARERRRVVGTAGSGRARGCCGR